MKSNRDYLTEAAMNHLDKMERDPAYRILRRQIEEEQRNPGHRIALEMARRQIDLEQRDPGLRLAREQWINEHQNPFLRIAREHINERRPFDDVYRLSSRSLRQFDPLSITERFREWETKIPDWVFDRKSNNGIAFQSAIEHLSEAQRMAERFGTVPLVELRNLDRLQDLRSFATLSAEITRVLRSFPPEMKDTFLVQANEKLELIRESADKRDAVKLNEAFESFTEYLLSWLKELGSTLLTPDAIAILITVVIAALQQTQSYEWRLQDQREAEERANLQNEKLDSILQALTEQQKKQQLAVGKPYLITRTTAAYARPGRKQRPVGYVYAGWRVFAVGSTGRWILIEWTDPFDLEQRFGWIRKKYGKLDLRGIRATAPGGRIHVSLAIDLYKRHELSLGQAAKLAGFSKRDFIDVLGEHHVPVINYSPEELREEIGV